MLALPNRIPQTRISTRIAATIVAAALISTPFAATDAAERSNEAGARAAETTALAESTGLHHEQLRVYPVIAKYKAEVGAVEAIAEANTILAAVSTKIDSTSLSSAVASLGEYKALNTATVINLTERANGEAQAAAAAGAEVDRVVAEQAAAAAAAAAEAQRVANTPDGARNTARNLAANGYGWGEDQFQCLNRLWYKESRWEFQAQNNSFSPSSAPTPANQAYGIVQSGPGSKMSSAGADWETNAATQIAWGLGYIGARYGSPCSAWSHSTSHNWY